MDCAIVSISAVLAVRAVLELWKHLYFRISTPTLEKLLNVGVWTQKYKCFRSGTQLVAILVSCKLFLMSLVGASLAFSMRVTSKATLLPVLPFLLSLAATLFLFIPSCRGSKVVHGSLNRGPGMSPRTVGNLLNFDLKCSSTRAQKGPRLSESNEQ